MQLFFVSKKSVWIVWAFLEIYCMFNIKTSGLSGCRFGIISTTSPNGGGGSKEAEEAVAQLLKASTEKILN